jgi:hypothetical protein
MDQNPYTEYYNQQMASVQPPPLGGSSIRSQPYPHSISLQNGATNGFAAYSNGNSVAPPPLNFETLQEMAITLSGAPIPVEFVSQFLPFQQAPSSLGSFSSNALVSMPSHAPTASTSQIQLPGLGSAQVPARNELLPSPYTNGSQSEQSYVEIKRETPEYSESAHYRQDEADTNGECSSCFFLVILTFYLLVYILYICLFLFLFASPCACSWSHLLACSFRKDYNHSSNVTLWAEHTSAFTSSLLTVESFSLLLMFSLRVDYWSHLLT